MKVYNENEYKQNGNSTNSSNNRNKNTTNTDDISNDNTHDREYLHARDLSRHSKLPRTSPRVWSVGTALNPKPVPDHQWEFAGESFSLECGLGANLILESWRASCQDIKSRPHAPLKYLLVVRRNIIGTKKGKCYVIRAI